MPEQTLTEWLEQETDNAQHGLLCAKRALEQAQAKMEQTPWWCPRERARWRKACKTAATAAIRQYARRQTLARVRLRLERRGDES